MFAQFQDCFSAGTDASAALEVVNHSDTKILAEVEQCHADVSVNVLFPSDSSASDLAKVVMQTLLFLVQE